MLSPTEFQIGQTPIVFLVLKDKETGNLIAKSSVTAIKYTLYNEDSGNRTAVAGHNNVDVSLNTYYDVLQTSGLCSITGGFNFKLNPDSNTDLFFPKSGLYRLMVTFTITGHNPQTESIQFMVI